MDEIRQENEKTEDIIPSIQLNNENENELEFIIEVNTDLNENNNELNEVGVNENENQNSNDFINIIESQITIQNEEETQNEQPENNNYIEYNNINSTPKQTTTNEIEYTEISNQKSLANKETEIKLQNKSYKQSHKSYNSNSIKLPKPLTDRTQSIKPNKQNPFKTSTLNISDIPLPKFNPKTNTKKPSLQNNLSISIQQKKSATPKPSPSSSSFPSTSSTPTPITSSITFEQSSFNPTTPSVNQTELIPQHTQSEFIPPFLEDPPAEPITTIDIAIDPKEKQKLERQIQKVLKRGKIAQFDIDNFNIQRQLGDGSYGVIFQIQDKDSKLKYALKKIIAHDIEEVEIFQHEFELVNSVNHPHIMKIYGICTRILDLTTIAIYVLMEMAVSDWDNEIKKHINNKKIYKERDLLKILRQLVSALTFMQKHKISHRDIKPQNILVFRQGVYKLADFGEAKEVKISKQLNTLRGTELYMSPILYEGLKQNLDDVRHNSFKSDVFSLGYCFIYAACLNFDIIYELREITDTQKIESILNRSLQGKFSDKFITLLCKMLNVDEHDRFDFIKLQEYLDENFLENNSNDNDLMSLQNALQCHKHSRSHACVNSAHK